MSEKETTKQFFEVFGIDPITIYKGQKYLTTNCRVAEHIATEDILRTITAEKILELEEVLLNIKGNFACFKSEGTYSYNHDGGIRITRLVALLIILIQLKDEIYNEVRGVFEL